MKNIVLSDFKSELIENLVSCESFCQYRNILYACAKGKVIKRQGICEEIITNLSETLYNTAKLDDVPLCLDISYNYETDFLHLIFFKGDIVSLDLNVPGSENIIGTIEGGIKASKWSPENEVIALVTGNDTVILMTNDFEPVSEVYLHGGDFGENKFITVGWGKKETQFRGTEGKFSGENKEEILLFEKDNTIKISWRGDAEYFAVSSINPRTSLRYLRIFSRNGILQYTSEDLNGVEHFLDWSPSGNLMASTQKLPNKYIVCFFEKNGLRHGEFSLPLGHKVIKVNNLLWNRHSKILVLLITKLTENSDLKYIQLYTVSNYHWSCKYTINLDSCDDPVLLQWDCQRFNTLHMVNKKNGKLYHSMYSWLWTIHKSKGNNLEDESIVAVIDGCNLKLTFFAKGIIPPPLCHYVIQLPVPVNSVCFAPVSNNDVSPNDLLVHLSNGSLALYKFVFGQKNIEYMKLCTINKMEKEDVCYGIEWISAKTFMFGINRFIENKTRPFLGIIEINFEDFECEKKEIELPSSIAMLKASDSVTLIHSNDGKMYLFDKSNDTVNIWCPENKTLIDLKVKDMCDQFIVYSLDNLNRFYINNKIAFNNVSSFHIHENFVILTTMKHELVCLNAENELTQDLSGAFIRKVERGSKIVTSTQNDTKLILQLPRGNLECLQVRALSLYALGKLLNSLQYHNAFNLMRKQRINLNLLHDHNPILFSDNIETFIDQIRDLDWISLFVSDLSEEDVTKTMYSFMYSKKPENTMEKTKINSVCNLIERTLTKKENPDKYILPILTCYIKRGGIEDSEAVLLKLKDLKDKELRGIQLPISFDQAFKYVLYLINVDELYKTALGMYDFDLVLMVASKSQKDPKEYLPFLNELRKLEPNYQKFTIDKYLKRFKKALQNLIKCEGDEVFNECINFVKAHKLYKTALKFIPQNTDRYKNICICYGKELMNNHLYEEAGIMFSNAGMYKNAVEAYMKAGNWQEVLQCGKESGVNENELGEIYLDLAMMLHEQKQYKEAAVVYLDYLKDTEECLRSLSAGRLFGEAYRVCFLYDRSDLISDIVVPAIIEQGNHMLLQIHNFSETFTTQKNRLMFVRQRKKEDTKDRVCEDFFSETNTVITQSNATSRTTNRTYRSAKNKRKQEKKLLSLKEGSPYEDLALVASLHNIVTNCYDLKIELKELNRFLVKNKQYDIAESLQSSLVELLNTIESSKSEIWIPDLITSRQSYGPQATSNEIASMHMRSECVTPMLLNPKYVVPPEATNVRWQLEIL